MTQSTSPQDVTEGVTAFCATCPAPEEVSHVLAQWGFQLVFQLPAMIGPPSSATASLPAQYHYHDAMSTEVIYLAGRDPDQGHQRLPAHASRWWLYRGHDAALVPLTAQRLSTCWPLIWQAEHVTEQAA